MEMLHQSHYTAFLAFPLTPDEDTMMLNAQTPTRPAITAAFEVIPTGAILGAEVRADDLRTLDHAGFAHVLRAWHAHSVVLFRNQALSDHDLIAFSRRL